MTYHTYPRCPPGQGTQTTWKAGDIAFLKPAKYFSRQDKKDLVDSNYICDKASTHPAIIVAAQNGKAIIMLISAFATEKNDFLPPWMQQWHQAKNLDHFRAFVGTRRPNQRHAALRLADPSMKMPKPAASWVYVKNFWCVPFSVLGRFDKSPVLLRVHPESLEQLKKDAQQFKKQYQDSCIRFNGPAGAPVTPAAAAAAAQAPSRTPKLPAYSRPGPSSRVPGSQAPTAAPRKRIVSFSTGLASWR